MHSSSELQFSYQAWKSCGGSFLTRLALRHGRCGVAGLLNRLGHLPGDFLRGLRNPSVTPQYTEWSWLGVVALFAISVLTFQYTV